VVVPDGLLSVLSDHVATYPSQPGEPIFSDAKGNRIRRNAIGHVWRRAAIKAEVTGHSFHSLRHFAASGMIAAGLSVVAVQRHLGHANPSITLNVYGHLWPTDGESTRAALGNLFCEVVGRPVSDLLAPGATS
jgi:integrase